jgi:hypothetical protein
MIRMTTIIGKWYVGGERLRITSSRLGTRY